MFSIDLLKGKGKPLKSDPKRTMLKTVPFLIPLIAVVAWAASYQQDCSRLQTQKAAIEKNQAVVDASQEAVEDYRQINAQITKMGHCLETITKGLSYRIQVSDLLVELAQKLPGEIFIYEMKLDRTTSVERLQQKNVSDAKEKVIVQRKLKLTLCGFDQVQSDKWVRDYVNYLKSSPVLANIFTDVKPAARRQGVVDQRPATYHEIECTLREQGQ